MPHSQLELSKKLIKIEFSKFRNGNRKINNQTEYIKTELKKSETNPVI